MPKLPETVSARPAKNFFVSMLTRDIELKDAILDLIDNCVDGAQRSIGKGKLMNADAYKGFEVEITFTKDEFFIRDNCGGIPISQISYAFRMGRPSEAVPSGLATVGAYGIGMKRAIFKLGKDATISTFNAGISYEVEISPEWLLKEDTWDLPVRKGKAHKGKGGGTEILVRGLTDNTAASFEKTDSYEDDLLEEIESHFAIIMQKGFKIKVNEKPAKPQAFSLHFDTSNRTKSIRPYIYTGQIEGVEIFLAVGFTRPVFDAEEADEPSGAGRYKSANSGWTVTCNDRVVLYCDKSILTGWGDTGVPAYHNQFIAISGIVEFKSDDPLMLPTTTTKRGLDHNSHIYLKVKNRMREGLKLFTNFTNKWKGREIEARDHISKANPISLPELKVAAKSKLRALPQGEAKQLKPQLPEPKKPPAHLLPITFRKPRSDIDKVAEFINSPPDASPSDIGEKCFDRILERSHAEDSL